jgi:hypothetical protein
VTYGIAEELLHLSIRYGPGRIPQGWPQTLAPAAGGPGPIRRNDPQAGRYRARFCPASLALALDEALQEAGVELWLDTLVSAPRMERRRVAGLEVENKAGRGLLRAGCLIDATGDADVAFRAGADCATGENWLSIWAMQASLDRARRAVADGSGRPLLDEVRLGGDDAGRGAPSDRRWQGTDGREVTEFVLAGRTLLREHYRARYAELGPGARSDLFPVALPAMAQLRTTRRIAGLTTLAEDCHGRRAEDSIALVADWRKAGCVWEIPYGTLLPRGVAGLLAAGRCISAEGDAWQVTRVIPAAAATGQAAGVAAALAARHNTSPGELEVPDVQEQLANHGTRVHLADVGL